MSTELLEQEKEQGIKLQGIKRRGLDTPDLPSYNSQIEVKGVRIPPSTEVLLTQGQRLLFAIENSDLTSEVVDSLKERTAELQADTRSRLNLELQREHIAGAVEDFLPSAYEIESDEDSLEPTSEATKALEMWLAIRLDEAEAEGLPVDDKMYAEACLLAEAMSHAQPDLNTHQLLEVAKLMVAEITAQRAANQVRFMHESLAA